MKFPVWVLLPCDLKHPDNLLKITFDGGKIGTPFFETEDAAIAVNLQTPKSPFEVTKIPSSLRLLQLLEVFYAMGIGHVIFDFPGPGTTSIAIPDIIRAFTTPPPDDSATPDTDSPFSEN